MFYNWLNHSLDKRLIALLVFLGVGSLVMSAPSAVADEGDFEEYYDDTTFEYGDEEYEEEVEERERLRRRRSTRVIRKDYYTYEGPYMGLSFSYAPAIMRRHSTFNNNNVSGQTGGLRRHLNALEGKLGAAAHIGYGEIVDLESGLYLGAEFSASTHKARYRVVTEGITKEKKGSDGYPVVDSTSFRMADVNMDYNIDLLVRLGFTVQPEHLFYFQGGYSAGFYDYAISSDFAGDLPLYRDSGVASGGNYGFGSEIAITDAASFRMSWVVREYGDDFSRANSTYLYNNQAAGGVRDDFNIRSYVLQTGVTFYLDNAGKNPAVKNRGGEVGDGFYAGIVGQHTNAGYRKDTSICERNPRCLGAADGEDTYNDLADIFGEDFFSLSGFFGYGTDLGKQTGDATFDKIYVGAEMEFGHPLADSETAHTYYYKDDATTAEGVGYLTYKRRMAWSLNGRVGYRITPQTLLYFKAGYGWTEMETRLNGGAPDGFRLEGYRIGLGTESVLEDNLFMRFDWTYTRHESRSERLLFDTSLSRYGNVHFGGYDDNRVSIGLGYNFKGIGMF